MPMPSAVDMSAMTTGAGDSVDSVSTETARFENAGDGTTHQGMGTGACVAVLTAAAILAALIAGARRRNRVDNVRARRTRTASPRRAPPRRSALTLAQLCVLRT